MTVVACLALRNDDLILFDWGLYSSVHMWKQSDCTGDKQKPRQIFQRYTGKVCLTLQ